MSKWEKFIFVLALAFWRAYFMALSESKLVAEEKPNDEDRARAKRFRDAVNKLRTPNGISGPNDTP